MNFTPAQIDAAARELMAVTCVGHLPEDERHRQGFRSQWNNRKFKKAHKDMWRDRVLPILQAAEDAKESQ